MLKNKRSLLNVLLVLICIVLSMTIFTGCGKKQDENADSQGSSSQTDISKEVYVRPLSDYFEGIKNKDLDQVLKAFPDFAKMSEKITVDDINDLYSQYEAIYGANIKIDYEFGEGTALPEEEISELEEELAATYTDVENLDITAAYTVPVTVTITGDGVSQNTENTENAEGTETDNNEEANNEAENQNVEEDEMCVLQYNGNWYTL